MKIKSKIYPPPNTPAYDALAEIGLAVVNGKTKETEKLSQDYQDDFIGRQTKNG